MKMFAEAIFVALFVLFYSHVAFAAPSSGGASDALQMLVNISNTYPAIWKMLIGLCYLAGFILAMRAVYQLKAYGELRTMMSSQTNLKVPLVMLLVAMVFIYLPTAFYSILKTGFGYNSPLAYTQSTASIDPIFLKAIVGTIQLVGVVAFIRGWFHLIANVEHPGGQHSFGRAMTHIVGGVLAINIVGVTNILWNSFGFVSPLS